MGVNLWETVGFVVGRFFFSGSSVVKLDEKNRFVLPQQMRFGLIENGELKFSLGLGLGGALAIYRQSDIEQIVERFRQKQHVGRYQKFFTLFFSTLYREITCDKVGRIIIPPVLKKTAGIQNEIVVAGVLNKIEIWPREKYEEQVEGLIKGQNLDYDLTSLTEEAFALLGDEEKSDESP